MEIRHNIPNIELRSEEVQELMGKIPPAILRVGISVILVFVILIFIASNFIKYPDIISVPIVAKNVNRMSEIKSVKSGILVDVHMEYGRVCMGDTLAKVEVSNDGIIDTVCVKSPFTGVIFPCDSFQEMDYVDEDDVLCVVVDTIKNKITAKASISAGLKKKIVSGMLVESMIEDKIMQGKVVSIADYANPTKETYRMTIVFENSKVVENSIFWSYHTNAKIKKNEVSVFEKFFKDRIVSFQ